MDIAKKDIKFKNLQKVLKNKIDYLNNKPETISDKNIFLKDIKKLYESDKLDENKNIMMQKKAIQKLLHDKNIASSSYHTGYLKTLLDEIS